MVMAGDLGVNWKKFKNNFELYCMATGCSEKPQSVQAAVLLHCIGEEALDIYQSFELSDDEKTNSKVLLEKFGEYFLPKQNISVESHKFNTRVQSQGESFDAFLTDLRRLAANCDFGAMKDRLITDRIVSGIYERRIKDRLLREDKLDIKKAIDLCRAAEQADEHIRQLTDKTKTLEVDEVKKSYKNKQERSGDKRKEFNQNASNKNNQNLRTENDRKIKCNKCGYNHPIRKCFAYGKQCKICEKFNHFANCCYI